MLESILWWLNMEYNMDKYKIGDIVKCTVGSHSIAANFALTHRLTGKVRGFLHDAGDLTIIDFGLGYDVYLPDDHLTVVVPFTELPQLND